VNFVPDTQKHAKPQLPPAFSLENSYCSRFFEDEDYDEEKARAAP